MGSEGEARGKRESETAPHHVILLLLFSLPLTPSSMSLMLQRIPASVCAFVFTSRRFLAIAQAPKGAGRVEAHRCDSQEGDGRIRWLARLLLPLARGWQSKHERSIAALPSLTLASFITTFTRCFPKVSFILASCTAKLNSQYPLGRGMGPEGAAENPRAVLIILGWRAV